MCLWILNKIQKNKVEHNPLNFHKTNQNQLDLTKKHGHPKISKPHRIVSNINKNQPDVYKSQQQIKKSHKS